MTDLNGRTIALTGAGSGIGRALARLLATKGVRLALADKDAAGLSETKALLGNSPATTTVLDVADDAAIKAWIDEAAREYGGLDGIVNNAGLSVVAPFAETPPEDFQRVIDVNFGGVVSGCRYALPHLRGREAAWIVNISSVFGMIGYPTQSAYNASKFAVRGLTEALYIELGQTDPNVRVIRVHPGGIKTNVARNAKFISGMNGQAGAFDSAATFEKNAPTTPEQAAATIVRGMENGSPRVLIGRDARLIDLVVRLFPVSYARRLGVFLGRT